MLKLVYAFDFVFRVMVNIPI